MTPESKHDKFVRIGTMRLQKAVYHINLLRNLGSSDYECGVAEAKAMVATLQEAVDAVASALKISPHRAAPAASAPTPPATPELPPQTASHGQLGPLDVSEVSWALGMLRRGDLEEATALLKRVVKNAPRDFHSNRAAIERH